MDLYEAFCTWIHGDNGHQQQAAAPENLETEPDCRKTSQKYCAA